MSHGSYYSSRSLKSGEIDINSNGTVQFQNNQPRLTRPFPRPEPAPVYSYVPPISTSRRPVSKSLGQTLDDIFVMRPDKPLGEGTYGKVMVATSERWPGIDMVVKKVAITYAGQLPEFEREARIQIFMASNNYTCSPVVYYLKKPPMVVPSFGFIVMEKLTMNLLDLISGMAQTFGILYTSRVIHRIAKEKIVPLLRQLMLARVIHYDLKPNNLVVRFSEPPPNGIEACTNPMDFPMPDVKIIDFGMAQEYSEDWRPLNGLNSNCKLRLLTPPLVMYDWAMMQYSLNVCIARGMGKFLMNLEAEHKVNIIAENDYKIVSAHQLAHSWPWNEHYSAKGRQAKQ